MSTKSDAEKLLSVGVSPTTHCGKTVTSDSQMLLLGLLPAAMAAVCVWGLPALRVMALATATGVVTEAVCSKLMNHPVIVRDFTAVVSCLLLAFLMPASAPWWLVVVGAVLCITLGKMVFGGFGSNPLNTTLIGWAMISVSWPHLMNPNAMQLLTDLVDPLTLFKSFGVQGVTDLSMWDLFLGLQIGGLGATHGLLLAIGGIFVIAFGVMRWEISLGFFGGLLGAAALAYIIDPQTNASPLFHVLTGSAILGGFFLAPEWASSPTRRIPMVLYGIFAGVMVIIIRKFGIYPDGVPFAVLLANLVAPLFDFMRPRPFGMKKRGKV